jgi:hypothetical protein
MHKKHGTAAPVLTGSATSRGSSEGNVIAQNIHAHVTCGRMRT